MSDQPTTTDTAPGHLRLLAAAYEDVENARAVFTECTESAKAAKQSLDRAVSHVLDLIRDITHPRPLPLFDAAQAEADRDRLTAAAGTP